MARRSKDPLTAEIPQDHRFNWPAWCVCCSERSTLDRDLETSTPHRVPAGDGGFHDFDLPLPFPGVPYCEDHAAELDAHLARSRREIRKKDMPQPKVLQNGKPATFHGDPGRGRLGGTLGFFAFASAKVVGSTASVGHISLTFDNPEYAAMFRKENSLMSTNEWAEHLKQAKRERREERRARPRESP